MRATTFSSKLKFLPHKLILSPGLQSRSQARAPEAFPAAMVQISLCCDHPRLFPGFWVQSYRNWQLPIPSHSLSELPCITCRNSQIHLSVPRTYPALVCYCRAGLAICAFCKEDSYLKPNEILTGVQFSATLFFFPLKTLL